MAYETQTWADGEDGGTPITAEALNHMEDGIEQATTAAAAAQAAADGKADPGDIPDVSGFVTQTDFDALVQRVSALETADE